MKPLLLGVMLLVRMAMGGPACGSHGDRGSLLVNTAWMAEHLHDANLAILAVGDRADFEAGHIPGSVYLDYAELRRTGSNPTLQTEMRTMPELGVFEKAGVSNGSRIVLYMLKDWITPTARAYLTLDAMGLGAQAALLDGGFPAWRAAQLAVTNEVRAVKPGKVEPCPPGDVIVTLEYVKANLNRPGVTIADARLAEFYSGASPSMGKSGHIPGAVSLPFSSMVDEQSRLLPPGQLADRFRAAGVKPGDRVVTYCHVGQQASFLYFVARYLGYDARMYDGSWDEWSKHEDLPAESGK
jgi:thiosulfate/3-mercaptopyruvate sulfurtransferase